METIMTSLNYRGTKLIQTSFKDQSHYFFLIIAEVTRSVSIG